MAHGGWRAVLVAHGARPRPSVWSRLLQPLSWVYRLLAWVDRTTYAIGLRKREHPGVPVLVVGNLVAGGAGKTPTVIHLVHTLRRLGWTPGVVSRGHGRGDRRPRILDARSTPDEVGDEPLLIHRRTGAPVAVAPRRIDAARRLRQQHPEVNLIVSDDGLQHHALARDAQVIVFDGRGVGNGLCLPAGPLREPMPIAPPPRSIVLYTHGEPSTPWPGMCAQRRLAGITSLEAWWRGDDARSATQPLATLQGREVWAAAGLAHPEPFFAMLQVQGLQLHRLPLPDHHDFRTLPWPAGASDVVVTEKDAIKLAPERCRGSRVWVATLDFQPEPGFDDSVLALLPPAPAAAHPTSRPTS